MEVVELDTVAGGSGGGSTGTAILLEDEVGVESFKGKVALLEDTREEVGDVEGEEVNEDNDVVDTDDVGVEFSNVEAADNVIDVIEADKMEPLEESIPSEDTNGAEVGVGMGAVT